MSEGFTQVECFVLYITPWMPNTKHHMASLDWYCTALETIGSESRSYYVPHRNIAHPFCF